MGGRGRGLEDRLEWDVHHLSGGQVAELFGVTRPAVRKWFLEGCPRNGDRTYRLGDVIAWRFDRLEEEYGAKGEASSELERLRAARADIEEFKRDALKGQLVYTADVEAKWTELLTVLKRQILGMPASVAPRLAHREARDIVTVLKGACEQVLRNIVTRYRDGRDG